MAAGKKNSFFRFKSISKHRTVRIKDVIKGYWNRCKLGNLFAKVPSARSFVFGNWQVGGRGNSSRFLKGRIAPTAISLQKQADWRLNEIREWDTFPCINDFSYRAKLQSERCLLQNCIITNRKSIVKVKHLIRSSIGKKVDCMTLWIGQGLLQRC